MNNLDIKPEAATREGGHNSPAARAIIEAAMRPGAHRLRRLGEACRLAGRNGVSLPEFAWASEEALDATGLFTTARAWRRRDGIEAALSVAFVGGTTVRARKAAEHHLDGLDLGPENKGDHVARGLIEAIAWASLPLWPDEVARLAVEALQARGLSLSPFGRKALPTWSSIAVSEAPDMAAYVPPEGQDWPEPVYVDPWEFAQREPTDEERARAEAWSRAADVREAAEDVAVELADSGVDDRKTIAREIMNRLPAARPKVALRAAKSALRDIAWRAASARRPLPVPAPGSLLAVIQKRQAEHHAHYLADAAKLHALPAAEVMPKTAAEIDPFDFDALPGLLGAVARWSDSFAFKPVREFATASAIALISVLFGRRHTTPTGLGLNVYMIGLAPTGGGKEAAIAAPQALLDEAGFSFLLGPGDFASDSAIEKSLRARPCQLMALDEVGQLLGAMQGKNAPVHAKLARKTLLEVNTKSGPGGRWTGKARAGDTDDQWSTPIYSPTLSLLGCSTVEGFFEGLTEANLSDGFVNRLIVVRAEKIGPRNMNPNRTTIPEPLVLAIRDAYSASKVGEGNLPRMSSDKPTMKTVPWADDAAEAEWLAVDDWQDAERERTPGREGIIARAASNTLKLATIAALARSPGKPVVTADDVRWGFALVRASIATVDEGVSLNMAGSEFEALVKAIERAVLAAGSKGIAYSDLVRTKGVSKADDRMVKAALERLGMMGVVERDIGIPAGGGRARNRVRAL